MSRPRLATTYAMHTYMMNADELIFIYANVLVLLETRVRSTLNMLYRTFTYVMNVDELILYVRKCTFLTWRPFR